MKKPTGILIAAGLSRRFGSDKLSHPLADGTPMALASFRNLQPVCSEVLAVLRPEQELLASMLWDAGARIVTSESCRDGMGHTLAAGVCASAEAAGWILALADMPYVRTTTMQRVAQAVSAGASIAAPVYAERRGHPVGFAAQWYAHLSQLCGDRGARELLHAHAGEITLLACKDAGIHRDIDTPADLQTV